MFSLGACAVVAAVAPSKVKSDMVIAEDLVIQGSTCIGEDCTGNNNFGSNTMLLKEEDIRIRFEDTSTQPIVSGNDWEIQINDSGHFGQSHFSIIDITAGKTLLKLCADNQELGPDCTSITPSDISITENTTAIQSNTTAIQSNASRIRKNKKAINTNRANINSLGDGIAASTALSVALTALPVTPDDAPFSCGVGSGAYSNRFAMGLGCVAKLNQRLSLNAGGSHVFGGSSSYGGGSLDSVAWRGGFVLKLGKLDSRAATNEQLQSKVTELEERNAAVEEQNKALMSRLERLEAIALRQQPLTNTASLK